MCIIVDEDKKYFIDIMLILKIILIKLNGNIILNTYFKMIFKLKVVYYVINVLIFK